MAAKSDVIIAAVGENAILCGENQIAPVSVFQVSRKPL